MYTTHLRKVGGSVMMAVPPAILDMLDLQPGAVVALAVEGQRLIVETKAKPRYSLEELLDECDASAPLADEDRQWIAVAPVGREW